MIYSCKLSGGVSTVEEYSPHHPKVKGSSLAGTGRGEWGKKLNLKMLL